MSKLSPIFNGSQFISGVPASGALLFTYAAGSSTKQTVFKDEAGTIAHSNPIVLDSRGEADEPIWLTEGLSYKFVLAPSTDTDPPTSPIRTIDDISGVNDASVALSQWVDSGDTPSYVSATQFTIPGDKTSDYQVNRRVKCSVTSGTVYGYISASAYTSLTTVTVVLDGSSLDAGLSAVQLGILTPNNDSLPNTVAKKGVIDEPTTVSEKMTHTADVEISGSTLFLDKGADVASATALPLISDGNYFDVTGTTTITSFNSMGVGTVIKLHFDDALILTHDATDLILPSEANITTEAGDEAEFVEYANGDWRCVSYQRASGAPLVRNIVLETPVATTSGTSKDFTSIPSTVKRITVMISGMSTSGSSVPIIQIGDAGGVEASGYLGAAWESNTGNTANNTGFNLHALGSASNIMHGVVILSLLNASTNTWVASGNLSSSASAITVNISGSKALSDTLDRVRITTVNGTDAFDAGSVNISYE